MRFGRIYDQPLVGEPFEPSPILLKRLPIARSVFGQVLAAVLDPLAEQTLIGADALDQPQLGLRGTRHHLDPISEGLVRRRAVHHDRQAEGQVVARRSTSSSYDSAPANRDNAPAV